MTARRSLIIFFPLAFLLSWYPYLLGKTGLVKTSGGINPLGVAVAGIIVAGICYRGAGVKELLGRYLRLDFGWRPMAFALLWPIGISLLAAIINIALGAPRPPASEVAGWTGLWQQYIFVVLFIGLGEE